MGNISSPKQQLTADRLAATTGQILSDYVIEARHGGASFGEIAWDLYEHTRVRLTPKTVGLWYRDWNGNGHP